MDGIINFFKPKGMTSHDAVYYFRRLCKTKRVGHTGTLDPMATGVLPICIGKATRVSEYLLNVGKEYIGELTLGTETDTQDKEGKITNFSNKEVCIESLIKVFNDFKGKQEQIPPMYSAKKINGKKLYELAREGIVIERKSNRINISEIQDIRSSAVSWRRGCRCGVRSPARSALESFALYSLSVYPSHPSQFPSELVPPPKAESFSNALL